MRSWVAYRPCRSAPPPSFSWLPCSSRRRSRSWPTPRASESGRSGCSWATASTRRRRRRWPRQRTARAWLLAAAVACVAVALAGPRIGTALRQGQQESLDLLIGALDVSDSMRADEAWRRSRLQRAKLEIERIVEERGGDRVGLIVFAGEAFLQCPLTTDRGALRLFLDAADPTQVATQGTDFARALAVADRAFDASSEGQDARPRALLVVSDGEDHEGGARSGRRRAPRRRRRDPGAGRRDGRVAPPCPRSTGAASSATAPTGRGRPSSRGSSPARCATWPGATA